MSQIKETHNQSVIKPRIPDELIYEVINGKPVYYKNYHRVINQSLQIEQIMGSSFLQAQLIKIIVRHLFNNLDLNIFDLLFNELGIHIDAKDNIAADIAIFNKEILLKEKIENTYIKIPPKVIIEIDTKADLSNFDNVMDYYSVKTNKLFKFGVDKVFWILTKNKQVIEATANSPWLIKKWDDELHLIDNIQFTINSLLKEDGIFDLIDQD